MPLGNFEILFCGRGLLRLNFLRGINGVFNPRPFYVGITSPWAGRFVLYPETAGDLGCFLLFQRFRKFWLEFKWKGPLFLSTGIFGITSGGWPGLIGKCRCRHSHDALDGRFAIMQSIPGFEPHGIKSSGMSR